MQALLGVMKGNVEERKASSLLAEFVPKFSYNPMYTYLVMHASGQHYYNALAYPTRWSCLGTKQLRRKALCLGLQQAGTDTFLISLDLAPRSLCFHSFNTLKDPLIYWTAGILPMILESLKAALEAYLASEHISAEVAAHNRKVLDEFISAAQKLK